jgi:hypothetical protein
LFGSVGVIETVALRSILHAIYSWLLGLHLAGEVTHTVMKRLKVNKRRREATTKLMAETLARFLKNFRNLSIDCEHVAYI